MLTPRVSLVGKIKNWDLYNNSYLVISISLIKSSSLITTLAPKHFSLVHEKEKLIIAKGLKQGSKWHLYFK